MAILCLFSLQIVQRIEGIDDKNKELVTKYKKEMALRKKLHNELVDLKGNIRVYCRVRPLIKEDGGGKMAANVVSFDEDDDGILSVFSKGSTKLFEMDKVFTPESTQQQVRKRCTVDKFHNFPSSRRVVLKALKLRSKKLSLKSAPRLPTESTNTSRSTLINLFMHPPLL